MGETMKRENSLRSLESLLDIAYAQLVSEHPAAAGFFSETALTRPQPNMTVRALVESVDEFDLSDCGMSAEGIRRASFPTWIALRVFPVRRCRWCAR